MGKFEGILICTDLDGTLLRNDKTVSRENLEAIEYFKSEGGYFTFVTGRMPCSATRILETVKPNAPIGCINGGGVFDHRTGQYLWKRPISRDVLEMVEYVDHTCLGVGIQVNTFDTIYFAKDNSAMELFREQTNAPNLVCHYREVEGDLAKIVFGDRTPGAIPRLDAALKCHPMADRFDLISSDPMLYEILPKGSNKGVVLPKLAEILSIDPAGIIAVGDYSNDVEMIRAAAMGIAVANATEDAKAVAKHITVSNQEHAIARIISDIESGSIRLDLAR